MRFALTLSKFFLFAFLFNPSFNSSAQTGTSFSGVILDAVDSTSLPGASVFLENTNYGTMADGDGKYEVSKFPAGTYNLIFMSYGYVTDTLKNVTIAAGSPLTFNRYMRPDIYQMETVEIIGERNMGSDVSVMEEKKNNDQVTEVIGSKEISRTAASTTADVAKRVPGITIQDGRFVIIRGLSQRYNAVMLNNALAPSSESDIKAFSFDIIPSSMIDRMVIYKTASPELPGEFAGGAIKIYTKNVPEKTSLTVGYGVGMRQFTTSRTFKEQTQGDKFWLGFDDGTYNNENIPGSIPNLANTPARRNELVRINGLFRNDVFLPGTKKAPLDQRVNLNFTGKIDLGEKARLGNVTIVNYSNTYSRIAIFRGGYNKYNKEFKRPEPTYIDNDLQHSHAVNMGVMHNWGLRINKNHQVEFKNLFNQLANSSYTFREENNFEQGFYRNDYFLKNLFRTMYSGQLTGSHKFNAIRTKAEWTAGYSQALRNSPDFRRYRQQRDLLDPSAPLNTVIQTNVNPYFLGRLYSKTNENIKMASLNLEHVLKYTWGDSLQALVRGGMYVESKDRTFNVRNLGYRASFGNESNLSMLSLEELFAPQNFNSQSGLLIGEQSNPSFSYTAGNQLYAYYIGVEIPLTKRINIYPGLRVEDNIQTLNSFDANNGQPVVVDNHIVRYLPSVNISYALKKDTSLIRFAYAETVNRPEFREIAPLNYFDFEFNQSIIGNPKLKTPKIHNLDLRYEYYPRAGETYSIGLFYKRFINPIETYFVESNNPVFTFDNADFARNVGVEIEVKKSLMDMFNFGMLKNISLALNGAVIESKIDVGNSPVQNQQRQMQGQSPYIVNAAVYYNNEKLNWQVNAIYNIIGKRIFIVGNTIGYPDVYEMPRNALDLTSTLGIGKYMELRVTLQNVFNPQFTFMQDANEDGKFDKTGANDQLMIAYKTGRYFTCGITGKF